MNNDSYAFSVAKIRALENKLVNCNQIERLVDAPNASAFFEAMSDTAYSQYFTDTSDVANYQTILDKELVTSKKVLRRIAPDPEQLDWLWLKYDFLNLKLLIKNQLADKDLDKLILLNLGEYDSNDLKNYVAKQETGTLPKKIIELVDQAKNNWEEKKDPKKIDFILDKAYFDFMLEETKIVHSSLVRELIKRKIDLYNLKLFIRLKKLKQEPAMLEKLLINNGYVKTDELIKLYKEGMENLLTQPSLRDYRDIISAGLEYYDQTKSFLVFEKMSYEYFINRLRFTKYVAFGVEPLIAYWLAKDNEVNVLRIVMIGKLNNVEPKLIHQEMHKLYTEK